MIDKQIHRDELKLRLLMTNGCNLNCSFCLNDFQPKPCDKPLYLQASVARHAIDAYCRSVDGVYPPQVYFSGGEPTTHEDLIELTAYAKSKGCRVTINTNGHLPDYMESRLSYDEIHFGTYRISHRHAERVRRMGGSIQCVYSLRNPYVDEAFLTFYLG